MRGDDEPPDSMFSYVSPEQRVPPDHPLRAIRQLDEEILREMSRDFDKLYAKVGRPSIPPERLLRAQLLQIFYSILSELHPPTHRPNRDNRPGRDRDRLSCSKTRGSQCPYSSLFLFPNLPTSGTRNQLHVP
jgi:hypothetical protein